MDEFQALREQFNLSPLVRPEPPASFVNWLKTQPKPIMNYQDHTPLDQYTIAVNARLAYQGRDHETEEWQQALTQLNPPCAPAEPLPGHVLHECDQLIKPR